MGCAVIQAGLEMQTPAHEVDWRAFPLTRSTWARSRTHSPAACCRAHLSDFHIRLRERGQEQGLRLRPHHTAESHGAGERTIARPKAASVTSTRHGGDRRRIPLASSGRSHDLLPKALGGGSTSRLVSQLLVDFGLEFTYVDTLASEQNGHPELVTKMSYLNAVESHDDRHRPAAWATARKRNHCLPSTTLF